MTPEEQQKAMADAQKAALADKAQMDMLLLNVEKLRKEVEGLDVTSMGKRVDSIFAALQAAQIIAVTPTVAPIGDEIVRGAGFKDQNEQDPNLPEPAAANAPAPAPAAAKDDPPAAPAPAPAQADAPAEPPAPQEASAPTEDDDAPPRRPMRWTCPPTLTRKSRP